MVRIGLVLLALGGAICGIKGLISGDPQLRELGGVVFAFAGIGLMVSLER